MGVPSGSGAPLRSNAWPSVRMGIGGGAAVGTARKIANARTARRTRHPFVFACPVVSPPRSKASRRATLFSLLIRFQPWARLHRAEKGFKESSASSRSLEPKMVEVVECVPNFSEGRRKDIVDAIGAAIASVAGARILDVQMKAEIETNPDRKPDFGPARLHPTAGACIGGARPVLIAWNVNLRTADVGVAKRIAKAIRESDGGLPAVRAKGFALSERGLVQVSMNMVDYRRTSLAQAFEAIRALAEKEGVEIAESEVVGLVPLDALVDGATQYFKLARFHRDQILETRLWE